MQKIYLIYVHIWKRNYFNEKIIILDIDGVIVGEKIGFNSPDPHRDVIEKLKKIR